jgi:hypothetical protein
LRLCFALNVLTIRRQCHIRRRGDGILQARKLPRSPSTNRRTLSLSRFSAKRLVVGGGGVPSESPAALCSASARCCASNRVGASAVLDTHARTPASDTLTYERLCVRSNRVQCARDAWACLKQSFVEDHLRDQMPITFALQVHCTDRPIRIRSDRIQRDSESAAADSVRRMIFSKIDGGVSD